MFLYYGVTMGLWTPAFTLVGRAIGGKRISEAKKVRNIIMICSLILAILQALSLIIFRF